MRGDGAGLHRLPLDLVLAVDDKDIGPLVIAEDRRLRQHRGFLRPGNDLDIGEAAGAEGQIIGNGDAGDALPALLADHRGDLPHGAPELAIGANRRHRGGHADAQRCQVGLAQLGAQFHFAAAGDAEQGAAAGADHPAGLDIALQDQPCGRRFDVQPPDPGAGRAKLGLGDAHAGGGGIARRPLAVEIGLGHEAATGQRLGALQFRLGQRRVGAGDLDAGGQLRRLLGLHRPFDDGQGLPGADPAARLDQNARDHAAFAGHADRHVDSGGKRPGRGDRARHGLAAGDDDGDGRGLGAGAAGPARGPARFIAAAAEQHEGRDDGDDADDRGDDDVAAPLRAIDDDQRIGAFQACFPVHA